LKKEIDKKFKKIRKRIYSDGSHFSDTPYPVYVKEVTLDLLSLISSMIDYINEMESRIDILEIDKINTKIRKANRRIRVLEIDLKYIQKIHGLVE
jgi:hypothetical protein